MSVPGSLNEAGFQQLTTAAGERLRRGGDANVFLCLWDRFDAHRVLSALPPAARVHTLDLLKDLLGERIPPDAWRKKYDHIYPIEVPAIEIRKNLDVLLVDLPARSLARHLLLPLSLRARLVRRVRIPSEGQNHARQNGLLRSDRRGQGETAN